MAYIKLKKKKRQEVPTVRKGKYQDVYQDKRWKQLRQIKLVNNPACERCDALGRVSLADEVHHIIPFDRGKSQEEIEALAFDYENLMSVCDACHDEIHKVMRNC